MLYSFDVFDTVITRITATPQGIFALMQERMSREGRFASLPELIRTNFCLLRTYAESLAHLQYTHDGIQEVTLDQIYKALTLNARLSMEQLEMLQALEIDTELQCVCPIEENIKRIEALLAQGERVVLISDMYLSRQVVEKMLSIASPVLGKLPLYLSSDWKKNKWHGGLFAIVKEQEQTEYADWLHIGDNEHSDVAVPKRFGIQTEWYKGAPFLEKETELLSVCGTDAHYQLNIGAARLARRKRGQAEGHAAWEIGCTYAGPILYPYVRWLLSESADRGLNRLYFIARDGFILKKIADIIIREEGLDIRTFYLYGSRKAWRMSSFSRENSDMRLLLKWSHERKILNLNQLANVFEIDYTDFKGFLPDCFLKDALPLDRRRLQYCEQVLDVSSAFKEFLMDRHREKRQLTLDYLKQEVDTGDDRFAFVELAGSGYTQECLGYLMRDFYGKAIRTFFFKMDRIEYDREVCDNIVFFTGLLKRHIIIEVICRAPHGQTAGYRREGESVLPCLEQWEEASFLEMGYGQYIDGILEFTRCYHKAMSRFPAGSARIDTMYRYLQYLSEEPGEDVLSFFGDLQNNETGREEKVTRFAPALSQETLRRLYLYRTTEPVERFYEGTYLEYSLLRCSAGDMKRIAFYKRNHGKLLGRAYRWLNGFRLEGRTGGKEGCQKGNIRPKREPYELDSMLLSGRIALYAAGKVGQSLYRQIVRTQKAQLVLWVDQESGRYDERVEPVERLREVPFDRLVVAVLKKEVGDDIQTQLLDMGIPEGKIFQYHAWRV